MDKGNKEHYNWVHWKIDKICCDLLENMKRELDKLGDINDDTITEDYAGYIAGFRDSICKLESLMLVRGYIIKEK